MIQEITERTERTERTVPELITCLSPSPPPDHEVPIFYLIIQMNKISCTAAESLSIKVNIDDWSLKG